MTVLLRNFSILFLFCLCCCCCWMNPSSTTISAFTATRTKNNIRSSSTSKSSGSTIVTQAAPWRRLRETLPPPKQQHHHNSVVILQAFKKRNGGSSSSSNTASSAKISSALRSSPSNMTMTATTTSSTTTFDEVAFTRALQEQLFDLQSLTTTTPPTNEDEEEDSLLSSSSSSSLGIMQYQEVRTISLEEEEGTAIATTTAEEEENSIWKARLLLVGAAALYGTNFSLVKLLGDTMPAGVSTTLRFALAAVVTLPWLIENLGTKKGSMNAAWLGFEVGLFNSIGYVTQAIGLDTTEASKSAFVCSLAVVIVPLLDFCTGKKLLPRQWMGVLLAVIGVAFLELGGTTATDGLSDGDLLSLVQPIAFGIGFWKMERAMQLHPNEASRITAGQLLAVCLASAAYCGWSEDMTTFISYPWGEWLSNPTLLFGLFWTGCITTALTIYMETLALKTLSAAETTLIFSTEPLWGTAFAAGVMGEQLGPEAGVGAFFILTACIYSNLGIQGIQELWNTIMMMTTTRTTEEESSSSSSISSSMGGATTAATTLSAEVVDTMTSTTPVTTTKFPKMILSSSSLLRNIPRNCKKQWIGLCRISHTLQDKLLPMNYLEEGLEEHSGEKRQ